MQKGPGGIWKQVRLLEALCVACLSAIPAPGASVPTCGHLTLAPLPHLSTLLPVVSAWWTLLQPMPSSPSGTPSCPTLTACPLTAQVMEQCGGLWDTAM